MSNIQEYVAAMQAAKLRLFHFTDSRNLDSIRAYGLLTTRDLVARGIEAVTGGDDASLGIDRHKGYDGYVRLSFCPNHPMAYVAQSRGSIERPKILAVCPSTLLQDGCLISDMVATANDATIGSANEMIGRMDFEAAYKYLNWKIPENHARRLSAEKWEALVPHSVATNLILGL